MSKWIKISEQKPVAPFWAKVKGHDEIKFFKLDADSYAIGISHSTGGILCEIEYWMPAEIPKPPELEISELKKAFTEWFQNVSMLPNPYQSYLAGFDKAVEVLRKSEIAASVGCLDSVRILTKFRGGK